MSIKQILCRSIFFIAAHLFHLSGSITPAAFAQSELQTQSTAATSVISSESVAPQSIRVATFNVSLYRDAKGQLSKELNQFEPHTSESSQLQQLARVIQTIRPDVLLLCEFDYESDSNALTRFANRVLSVDCNGPDSGIQYPHRLSLPSNTGVLSGFDLNADGVIALPNDGWGFGRYAGQYAMAVLSRYPIDSTATRTFQKFRWSALPEALRPADPESGQPFHDDATWKAMRLSSKNHADVVIDLPGESKQRKRLHFLVSHPTPPVFDGPEDLNGRRNHDEIDFWRRYISESDADYLIDDQGLAGGLGENDFFVIAGDLNSDPNKGDSRREGIRGLLDHRRIQDPKPTNRHGRSATASFGEGEGVRIDYVLPSSNMQVVASQVVWPRRDEPLGEAIHATDHRMVYVDLVVPE